MVIVGHTLSLRMRHRQPFCFSGLHQLLVLTPRVHMAQFRFLPVKATPVSSMTLAALYSIQRQT